METGRLVFGDTARKFEFGARNLPLRIGYGRALKYIEEIGLQGIQARVRETVGYFRERLSEIPGARVQTPAEFSAGAVNVAIEGVDPGAVRQALWDKYRIVAVSPAGGMRFSITFFTTWEEIDRVVEALKQEIA